MSEHSVLMIIDVQRGFINEWTRHVPATVERLQQGYDRVVATRFQNPEGSPYRELMDWRRFEPGSDDTELAFEARADAVIIDKETYTCIDGTFLNRLDSWGARDVDLCGIATENCVLKCAVDLFEAGRRPRVLAAHCASHGGDACHQAGLLVIRRFIGADRVV